MIGSHLLVVHVIDSSTMFFNQNDAYSNLLHVGEPYVTLVSYLTCPKPNFSKPSNSKLIIHRSKGRAPPQCHPGPKQI